MFAARTTLHSPCRQVWLKHSGVSSQCRAMVSIEPFTCTPLYL